MSSGCPHTASIPRRLDPNEGVILSSPSISCARPIVYLSRRVVFYHRPACFTAFGKMRYRVWGREKKKKNQRCVFAAEPRSNTRLFVPVGEADGLHTEVCACRQTCLCSHAGILEDTSGIKRFKPEFLKEISCLYLLALPRNNSPLWKIGDDRAKNVCLPNNRQGFGFYKTHLYMALGGTFFLMVSRMAVLVVPRRQTKYSLGMTQRHKKSHRKQK